MKSMTRALVDTNILVYAASEGESDKKRLAEEAIAGLAGANEMALSVQNLAEFSRVLLEKSAVKASRTEVADAVGKFSRYSDMLPYSGATVVSAIILCRENKIHFFDALLAATMLENSVFEIITENTSDFEKVPGIKARNPFVKKR